MSSECIHCKGKIILDEDESVMYCESCGTVFVDVLFEAGSVKGQEVFEETSLSTDEKYMNTYIDAKNKDSFGKTLSYKNKRNSDFLRIWQRKLYANTFTERSLHSAEAESERIAHALNLSLSVRHKIMELFRMAKQKNLTKGKNVGSVICALVYYLTLKQQLPLTLDEIVEFAAVRKGRITKIFKVLLAELGDVASVHSAKVFVRKYVNLLECSQVVNNEIYQEAMRILDENELDDGTSSSTLAAAVVYLAAKKVIDISLARYLAAVKITSVTLRNKLKKLKEFGVKI